MYDKMILCKNPLPKFIQLFIVFYPNPYFTLYDGISVLLTFSFSGIEIDHLFFSPNDILSVFCLLGYHAEFPFELLCFYLSVFVPITLLSVVT